MRLTLSIARQRHYATTLVNLLKGLRQNLTLIVLLAGPALFALPVLLALPAYHLSAQTSPATSISAFLFLQAFPLVIFRLTHTAIESPDARRFYSAFSTGRAALLRADLTVLARSNLPLWLAIAAGAVLVVLDTSSPAHIGYAFSHLLYAATLAFTTQLVWLSRGRMPWLFLLLWTLLWVSIPQLLPSRGLQSGAVIAAVAVMLGMVKLLLSAAPLKPPHFSALPGFISPRARVILRSALDPNDARVRWRIGVSLLVLGGAVTVTLLTGMFLAPLSMAVFGVPYLITGIAAPMSDQLASAQNWLASLPNSKKEIAACQAASMQWLSFLLAAPAILTIGMMTEAPWWRVTLALLYLPLYTALFNWIGGGSGSNRLSYALLATAPGLLLLAG